MKDQDAEDFSSDHDRNFWKPGTFLANFNIHSAYSSLYPLLRPECAPLNAILR
jgi:hypothetical protein